jgi:hypothetical protein
MLYIQIHDQKLIIAELQNKTRLQPLTGAASCYELDPLTIKDCVIYNKSKFLQPINDFLSTHKLKNHSTIVNIPELASKQDIQQTLAVLQFALILSKSGIKLEKITAEQPLNPATPIYVQIKTIKSQPDLLQVFKSIHSNISPTIWMGLTVLCSLCLIVILFDISHKYQNTLNSLTQQVTKLQAQPLDLAGKTKDFAILKKNNADLNALIANVQRYHTKKLTPLPLLTEISTQIPNDIWLTKIEIGNQQKFKNDHSIEIKNTKSKLKRQPHKLQLFGYSKQINSPYKFIEKIEKNSKVISYTKIAYIKKIKQEKTNPSSHKLYEFKVNGELAPSH